MKKTNSTALILAGSALLAILVARTLFAATLSVINTNDSGPGSLRQAIADAASGDIINFAIPSTDPGCTGGVCTIALTSGELLVSKSLTIAGPGAGSATVDGNNSSNVFHFDSGPYGIILSGLTITQAGGATGDGVLNESTGPVTIDSCIITANAGNISNAESTSLAVKNSSITNSTTQSGIQNIGGTMTIDACIISGNTSSTQGGRIFNQAGSNGAVSMTITNTIISMNSAAGGGGLA